MVKAVCLISIFYESNPNYEKLAKTPEALAVFLDGNQFLANYYVMRCTKGLGQLGQQDSIIGRLSEQAD